MLVIAPISIGKVTIGARFFGFKGNGGASPVSGLNLLGTADVPDADMNMAVARFFA